MEDKLKPRPDIFNYTFKHDYEEVVNLVRDFKKCVELNNKIIPDFSTDFKITKLNNTWEEGAEFDILFKKKIRLFFRTIKYSQTNEATYIKWYVTIKQPFLISYFMNYSIFNDSYNGLCSFVHEWEFPSDSKRLLLEKDEPQKEKYLLFNHYDLYLNNKSISNTHVGSCEIKSDILSIWKLISNLKRFVEKVPAICNYIYAEDEELTLGKIISLRWDSDYLKGDAVLKVIFIHKDDKMHLLTYELVEANPPRPKQKIQWKIEKKTESCILTLSHIYKEEVEKRTLNAMSFLKKEIFKQIKECLEESNST